MPKYQVRFEATADYFIVVEADSPEEAEEVAYEEASFPYFPGGMTGDVGEWFVPDGIDSEAVVQVDDDEPLGDGRW